MQSLSKKKRGPVPGEYKRMLNTGTIRLICNGSVIRERKFDYYAESKRVIARWVNDCKKIVENKNIVYIEVTKY